MIGPETFAPALANGAPKKSHMVSLVSLYKEREDDGHMSATLRGGAPELRGHEMKTAKRLQFLKFWHVPGALKACSQNKILETTEYIVICAQHS